MALNEILAHRGPDGEGTWTRSDQSVGLAHRRLSIIELSTLGAQPMRGNCGNVLTFNGEIYNYIELAQTLRDHYPFKSKSDSETILAAYSRFGFDCVDHLRGMFAFAVWDEEKRRLFCARDRFGIKPLYYIVRGDLFVFASEAKALLPFLPEIATDPLAFSEYLTFQYQLGDRTPFSGIKQLLPGHALCIENGALKIWRYWDVSYETDRTSHPDHFSSGVSELLRDSMRLHLRSDVEVGSYLSGGVDSSLVAILAGQESGSSAIVHGRKAFHGRFLEYPGYDESHFASIAAKEADAELFTIDITAEHFIKNIEKTIYHLDYPLAGPGSFPQFMVSKLASERVKVVLGGQGGDEVFGGYARYFIGYLDECLNAAIGGAYAERAYPVSLQSMIPNLGLLREYRPLLQQFFATGMFETLDKRYWKLVERSADFEGEIDWADLPRGEVVENYLQVFNAKNVSGPGSHFNRMTHFDFKCLLPALLQIEDRMSMAHGLESRVPILDHPLVEFAARVPEEHKYPGGAMKHLLKSGLSSVIPTDIAQRRDKMGFPVPLKEWFSNAAKEFVLDMFATMRRRHRPYVNAEKVIQNLGSEGRFSRKIWALLSLEIWHSQFHDRAGQWRSRLPESFRAF